MNKKIFVKLFTIFVLVSSTLLSVPTYIVSAAGAYDGITIDGDFSDWDAVEKYTVDDDALNDVAMIFDGDYIYVYLETKYNSSLNWMNDAQTNKFSFVTDLGYTNLFQVIDASSNPQVIGVDGAQIAHSDLTWGASAYYYEISIPASNLASYDNTISFGAYLQEPYISDVANLNNEAGNGGSSDDFDDISGASGEFICDGDMEEWRNIKHTLVQYSTSGTQAHVPDGEAAIYADGSVIYGHVMTSYREHMQSKGGDFTSGLSVSINGNPNKPSAGLHFYPQFVAIDTKGNVNYNPKLSSLPNGVYKFYLIDAQGWKSANISAWANPRLNSYGQNAVYGKAVIKIGPSKHEMEYELYIDRLAEKFNRDSEDLKFFGVNHGKIGPQWVHCAGTSTGPILSVLLSTSVAGAFLMTKKRKSKKL